MHPLIQLAKEAVETYIEKKEIIQPPDNLPKEFLEKKAGTFVTIQKDKQLKGCIGTYLPTQENIAKEVIRNAIAAATEDHRFKSVKKEELSSLSYIIYILEEPEPIQDIKELDPKKYGIIVKTIPISPSSETTSVFNGRKPFKSGLLLPDLEGINTPEEQIAIACQKGGINPIQERISIYRFKTTKYQ